ncbi:hypothetical protein ACFWY5_29765 [Nonomuraea sp. NPDC059007]|uniref:hypothetical protein n=1 Tax=Nonomuraea sp. NPDC059007 TaxID=3346692 RepID=UPI003678AAD5
MAEVKPIADVRKGDHIRVIGTRKWTYVTAEPFPHPKWPETSIVIPTIDDNGKDRLEGWNSKIEVEFK